MVGHIETQHLVEMEVQLMRLCDSLAELVTGYLSEKW